MIGMDMELQVVQCFRQKPKMRMTMRQSMICSVCRQEHGDLGKESEGAFEKAIGSDKYWTCCCCRQKVHVSTMKDRNYRQRWRRWLKKREA